MSTFINGLNGLMNGVNDYTGSYENEATSLLDSIIQNTDGIHKNGLNSSHAEIISNNINNFNSGIMDYDSYYQNLLDGASSNKAFINTLESQGVKVDKSFRKEIGNYRQQYVDKIQTNYQNTKQYFNDVTSGAEALLMDEVGYSSKEIQNHVRDRQKFISENIDPSMLDATTMIDKMQSQANLAAQEIQTTRQQYVDKLSNPNITQAEVNETMKEFNSWSSDYQRGAGGDTSFKINASNDVMNVQKENLIKQLEANGYGSQETVDIINDVFNKSSAGHSSVFGEDGILKASAMDIHESRREAMQRITGTGNPQVNTEPVVKSRRASNSRNKQPTVKAQIKNTYRTAFPKGPNIRRQGDFINEYRDLDTPINKIFEKLKMSPIQESTGVAIENMAKEQAKEQAVKAGVKQSTEEIAEMSTAKRLLKKHGVNSIVNIGLTVADYKESRREGQGVLKSATKAGVNFAIGETLGMAAVPFYLASSIPTMAVKAVEGVNKMERQMNSVSRTHPFADTYFQDTQQMATMRQSGMEMAKMSQYNLQQTLMGAEATHLHR